MSDFQRVITDDQILNRVQDNLSATFNSLNQGTFIGGNVINSILLITGSNQIAHGLGKTPTRWVQLDITAPITLYRTAWDTNFIYLTASSAATLSLWVNS